MIAVLVAMAALAQQAASLPAVNGTRLRAGTTCYSMVRGGQAIGSTLQSIRPVRAGGVRAWDIVVHQRAAGGRFDMRDHFIVRRSDLRPIRFESRRGNRAAGSGWHEIALDYGERRITGTRTGPQGTAPVDVALEGPVWEGNLWGATFGALPLRAGGRYRLPFWQYDKGFGSFIVNVVGTERVTSGGRPVDAWVVEAGDNPEQLARYRIARRDGYELGYSGGGMEQRVGGGDCAGMG